MTRLWTLVPLALSCVTAAVVEDILTSDRPELSRRFPDHNGRWNMSFYHINDVHAHLDDFTEGGYDCKSDTTGEDCFGGYARVKTYVSKGRKIHQDSLFLNMGDEFQGTSFFSWYHGGSKIAETLNILGFDAMTLGNHEFDIGDDKLAEFLQDIKFPVLSANIHSDNGILNKTIRKYHIFEDHRLAVIGVTTDQTKDISQPGPGTTFSDPIKTVQDAVDFILSDEKLQKKGINRIAAITHIGYEEDIRLAKESTGLHLILGGHSHTLLGNFTGSVGSYPTKVLNKKGEEVFVVQAHRWGENLGYIDVTWNEDGTIHETRSAPIRVTKEIEKDPYLQGKINEWRKPFDEENRKIVGHSESVLDHSACKTAECVLGNVITDAILESVTKNVGPNDSIPDLAIINGGGVRATIGAGKITYGNVNTAFPFKNSVVEFGFLGEHLWDLFEGILKRVPKNDTSLTISSFAQVSSGVRVRWEETESPNKGNLTSLHISGKPVDRTKSYTVLAIDFLANGGDNFFVPMIPKDKIIERVDLETALLDYLREHNPTIAGLEGRLAPRYMKRKGHRGGARRKVRDWQ